MIDAALWALAIVLLGLAIWLGARSAPRGDPGVFFAATMRTLFGDPVPLEGSAPLPDPLPDDVSPRRLGPAVDEEALAAWSPAVEAAVQRRLAGVTLVWFEPPAFDIPGLPRVVLPGTEDVDEALEAVLDKAHARVVVAAHQAAPAVLALLAEAPMLRDRMRAGLFVGATVDPAWLAANFDHARFDVELDRAVPYLCLRLPGTVALPTPPEPPTARCSIASIDLGEVDPAVLADPRLGRAIAALLASLG